MAFLIPDNLKTRRDVPPGIHRVARALELGLADAACVWYEPLYDPTGERPHLIVLVPGRGIAVLEVLELLPENRFLGFLRGEARLLRDGVEVSLANPLHRAERLAGSLFEQLCRTQGAEGLRVAAGAVLESLFRKEAAEKGAFRHIAADRCLTRTELELAIAGGGEPTLEPSFGAMFGEADAKPTTSNLLDVLRGIIQPELVLRAATPTSDGAQALLFRIPREDEDIVGVMDRKQELLAKNLGEGHRVIRGVAGSGKTIVLLSRARLLSRMRPDERFLVTCYTKALAAQLRALLADCANVEVQHLDRLMASAIRLAGLQHPGYDQGADAVANLALQALDGGRAQRYDGVLADEAQDFGTPALRFLVALLAPGKDELLVVADAAQNIFRRKMSWKQAGIQAQGRSRILRVNYRNTREILEFASRFLFAGQSGQDERQLSTEDENAMIPPERSCRSGPRPVVRIVAHVRAEIEIVVEQARRWAKTAPGPATVALLYGTQMDCGLDRAALVHRELVRSGVDVFWTHERQDRPNKEQLVGTGAPVVLTTIQTAKGLEFPRVLLFGLWRENEDAEANRRLAYVGMTRSTELLAIVTRQGHPLIDDLRAALK